MKNKYLFFLFIFHFTFFILHFSIANAIEVGGHITENTFWTPDNNPYIVVDNIFVDQNVTLTILPGTVVKINAAEYSLENDSYFWFSNGNNIAKMFWVDGRLIAEGTEQDSIVFTRFQDSLYYHWGTIYLPEQAELCRFKHCRFEYAAKIMIYINRQAKGAISIYNGNAIIENCYFLDNPEGISIGKPSQKILIMRNLFDCLEGYHPSIHSYRYLLFSCGLLEGALPILIAENHFYGSGAVSSAHFPIQFVNNTVSNCVAAIHCHNFDSPSYFYKNEFINNSSHSFYSIGPSTDTLYIKKNIFTIEGGTSCGVELDDVYAVISDNYFERCSLYGPSSPYYSRGKVENNIITYSGVGISGRYEIVQNNIIYNCGVSTYVLGSSDIFRNNLIFGNSYICNSISDNGIHENNIYLENGEIFHYIPSVYGNPIFRNCILDFELPPECIDGGGNIWVDSLSFDSLFVDWQNGDFHLIEGSLAIDAGFDTTGYYCPFDLDYNTRVWDGDSNGTSIIDIGPYEFGATQLGGICGTVYQTENGEPLDYVLLKINNEPGEFEFSDSLGYFEFCLPAGIYDIYAERVFYDDVVVEDIEVIEGEFNSLEFSMTTNLGVGDTYPLPEPTVFMNNYPNPFSSSTIISFHLATDLHGLTLIKIYNIKGQLVRTLNPMTNDKCLMTDVVWNGKDENGKPVASGIYFYKLSVGKKNITKKMIILR